MVPGVVISVTIVLAINHATGGGQQQEEKTAHLHAGPQWMSHSGTLRLLYAHPLNPTARMTEYVYPGVLYSIS